MVQNLLMNMLLDPLNDWEELGYLLMKDRFLYDYLSNLENFSAVFDEKVLMSTEYGGPPRG